MKAIHNITVHNDLKLLGFTKATLQTDLKRRSRDLKLQKSLVVAFDDDFGLVMKVGLHCAKGI